jgi:hypothetical protein
MSPASEVLALEKTVAKVERGMLTALDIQDQQIEALMTRPSSWRWVGLAFEWMLVLALFGVVVFRRLLAEAAADVIAPVAAVIRW